jgi:hypothetical protein
MNSVSKTQQYTIGGIRFNINLLCPLFDFDIKGGSHYFKNTLRSEVYDWTLNFNLINKNSTQHFEKIFTGSDKFEDEIPYKWSVIKSNQTEAIYVEFEDHATIKDAVGHIDLKRKTILVNLCLHQQQPMALDPFFHPLGILLLQYIVHFYGGFVIHASTVEYNNKGYLFSAVSGTGKSTMAHLWQKQGATIINDDRLMIIPDKDGFRAWNTPMPYYQDYCKNVKLHKAFLIKQSPTNYIVKLPVLKGTLGLLGNCMQFQYDSKQVENRLHQLQTIAESWGVYECGFKPDHEIVELILSQFD